MDILNDINFLMLKLYEVLIFIYCQNCRQASGMLLQGFLIFKPHAVIYKIMDILHVVTLFFNPHSVIYKILLLKQSIFYMIVIF